MLRECEYLCIYEDIPHISIGTRIYPCTNSNNMKTKMKHSFNSISISFQIEAPIHIK